jgi:hypothetical protein
MKIWFFGDANSDVESSDITHATDKDYGSSMVFEPRSCTMPSCEEQFDNGTTVLQFYLHIETSNHTCMFGCGMGFLNAHSLLRHYLSEDCQHLPTGDISTSVPSRLDHEHDITCELCSLVSADGRTLLARCTDFHARVAGSLSYAQKLEINTNLWVIPSTYASGFSSRGLLCRLYNGGQGGHYLIFIYRDSSGVSQMKSSDDSKPLLLGHSRHFLRFLRRTIKMHGKTTSVTLRASAVKSALMPQFIGDINLELEMSTSGLPLTQSSSPRTVQAAFNNCARSVGLFTKVIGAHAIHGISRGKTPILISNGINAFSTNWTRVRTYMSLVHQTYEIITLVIRLPEIANTAKLRNLCPHEDEEFSYGFYTAGQISAGTDTGVSAWKEELSHVVIAVYTTTSLPMCKGL